MSADHRCSQYSVQRTLSTKSHSALHGSRAEVKKALSRGTEIVLQTLKLGSLNVRWQ